MRILTFSVLCVFVSYHVLDGKPQRPRPVRNPTTTEEDYEGYMRALEVFRLAFDFSTEEQVIYPHINPQLTFGWDNTSWAMGVRGRDAWGKWYLDAECMAVMILPSVALMPCSCMWSWYTSFRQSGNFTPAPDRTEYDITTPELYLFHTLHEGEDYFKDEITRYYAVVNGPLESEECTNAIDIDARPGRPANPDQRNKQLDGWGLVELETPVYIGASIGVKIPVIYINDDFSEDTTQNEWSLFVLSYGTAFVDPNTVYIPEYALPEYNKKHERWRTWSNGGRIKNELITFNIKPRRGLCRDNYDWREEHRLELECWQEEDLQTQICDLQPGAPIYHIGGGIYGITMNKVSCPTVGNSAWLEVRRITDVKKDVIKELLKQYDDRVRIRQLVENEKNKAQQLFNLTLGEINYDEDIDPVYRFKIRNDIVLHPGPLGRSGAPPTSHSTHLALIVLGIPVLWHRYSK